MCQSSAGPKEGEFLLVSSQGGAQTPGWTWPRVPITPPRQPSSARAPRGHQWDRNRGTEGCRNRGGPGRAPQSRAGRAKAEDGENSSSWGKGDNTEGHLASSSPSAPLDTVLPPWLVVCLSPNTTQGGQKSHPVCPHSRAPQKAPRGRASAGLTWRLLVSPWSQALLVCFCFSVEGTQKVNPSRGAGATPG